MDSELAMTGSLPNPLRNFKMLRTPELGVATITTSPTTDEISNTVEAFRKNTTEDKNEDVR